MKQRFYSQFLFVSIRSFLPITLAVMIGMQSTVQAQERKYILATASSGGTYFPVGVALSTLIKIKLQPREGISLDAINSAGSAENIRLLSEGRVQLGIIQGLYGYYARTGTGPLEADGPQTQLRSITMLWQNAEQFIIASDDVETGDMSDLAALKGKPVAFGQNGSGALGSTDNLLTGLGLSVESDFSLFQDDYKGSLDALADGKAAAASIPSGIPTSAVADFFEAHGKDFTVLNFSSAQAQEADNGRELWTPYVIKAGTYPNQDKDINTIAQPNLLVTHAAVSSNDIYLITKTIYENLPFLQGIHPATKAMAIERALDGLPLPLHPGALKYYEEIGVEVPERLATAPDACICPSLEELLVASQRQQPPQIATNQDIEATLSLFAPQNSQFDPTAFAGGAQQAAINQPNVASAADIQSAVNMFSQSAAAPSGFDPTQFTGNAQNAGQQAGVASDADIRAAISLFATSDNAGGFDPTQFSGAAQPSGNNSSQTAIASDAEIQAAIDMFAQNSFDPSQFSGDTSNSAIQAAAPTTSTANNNSAAAAAPETANQPTNKPRSSRSSIFLNFN